MRAADKAGVQVAPFARIPEFLATCERWLLRDAEFELARACGVPAWWADDVRARYGASTDRLKATVAALRREVVAEARALAAAATAAGEPPEPFLRVAVGSTAALRGAWAETRVAIEGIALRAEARCRAPGYTLADVVGLLAHEDVGERRGRVALERRTTGSPR